MFIVQIVRDRLLTYRVTNTCGDMMDITRRFIQTIGKSGVTLRFSGERISLKLPESE
jgi:hypothetical protein